MPSLGSSGSHSNSSVITIMAVSSGKLGARPVDLVLDLYASILRDDIAIRDSKHDSNIPCNILPSFSNVEAYSYVEPEFKKYPG